MTEYKYIFEMKMNQFTEENIDKKKEELEKNQTYLQEVTDTSEQQMWKNDLNVIL